MDKQTSRMASAITMPAVYLCRADDGRSPLRRDLYYWGNLVAVGRAFIPEAGT
jgi:hypothetical protein